MNSNYVKMALTMFALAIVFISEPAFAQKYKTSADTLKLNKEYAAVSLDIAQLNAKLIAEKNKTSDYQLKSVSTAKEASQSASDSRDQAEKATNGKMNEMKKSVKKAKRAKSEADAADSALDNQTDNTKKIADISARLTKKQDRLTELDKQRAAILALK